MDTLFLTLAGLAAVVCWAAASPEFCRRLVAVCRALQAPAGVVLAVVAFYGGLWVLYAVLPGGLQ